MTIKNLDTIEALKAFFQGFKPVAFSVSRKSRCEPSVLEVSK